ncbi:Cation channel sperm-associated protein 1 [Acipenser ruthenus]|uniref:Cation channel sperm-associated protein 1 n=1 Tax=Acipenser ruthenus TaxID=7906 RepID=A0A444UYQ5_ACIRT|nr:Cation channel sperm-associated protein 1 [Acipenser ruthenus]
MFYQSDPDRFGTMFNTIFTLFQLLTLDDWSYIYTTSRERGSWFIIIFLALYIVVEYFTFLNLFIAVLVDNFQLTIKKRVARKKLKSTAKFDFEDDMGSTKRRDSQMETEQDDETFLKNIIKENYSQRKYPEKEAQLMFRYFQLLLEIEKHHHSFRAQAATLEKIIDSSFEVLRD